MSPATPPPDKPQQPPTRAPRRAGSAPPRPRTRPDSARKRASCQPTSGLRQNGGALTQTYSKARALFYKVGGLCPTRPPQAAFYILRPGACEALFWPAPQGAVQPTWQPLPHLLRSPKLQPLPCALRCLPFVHTQVWLSPLGLASGCAESTVIVAWSLRVRRTAGLDKRTVLLILLPAAQTQASTRSVG